MINMNKAAEWRASWDPNDPNASYWSTFNPISFLTGGVDKVPAWWMDKFTDKDVIGKLNGKQLGHLTFKAGAVGLLTAGIVGGLRLALGADDLIHGKGTVVDDSAKGKMSTTFNDQMYELDQYGNRKKKKKQVVKTASKVTHLESGNVADLSSYNQLGFAIPAAATALAAYLAYTLSDEAVAGARRYVNQQNLDERKEDLNALMIQRARMAKGNLKELPNFEHPYTKSAANEDDPNRNNMDWWDSLKGGIAKIFNPTGNNAATWGALKYAALLATGAGAYMYMSKNNENNMKYKAYKAALKEYVKGKTNRTPLTVVPGNSDELFDAIEAKDEELQPEDRLAAVNPRKKPQFYSDDLNTPISINI